MREVERLCARATIGGGVVPAAARGEVAVGLRALLPLVDDEGFDQYLARLDRVAGFISSAEVSGADDTSAYAEAAWTAGIELSAFGADAEVLEAGDGFAVESFRTAVIEYWDLVLRRVVAELVGAAESAAPFRPGVLADSRTA